MRGDPQVDLPGAVLVGRRFVREDGISPAGHAEHPAPTPELVGEPVTITGIILRIGSFGLTVVGPKPDVVHNVLWKRVRSLEFGENTSFEDGSPARSIDVELDDRKVSFLVPVAVLTGERRRIVNEITRTHLAPFTDVGPAPQAVGPAHEAGPAPQEVVVDHDTGTVPETGTVPGTISAGEEISSREEILDPAPRHAPEPGVTAPASVLLPPPPPRSNLVMPPAPRDAGDSPAVGGEPPHMNGTSPMNGSSGAPVQHAPMFLLPLAVPPARRVAPPRLPPPPPRPLTPMASWLEQPPEPSPLTAASPSPPPVSVPSVGPTAGPKVGLKVGAPEPSSGPSSFRLARPAPVDRAPRPTPTNASTRDHRRPRTKSVVGAGLGLVVVLAGGAVFGLSLTGHGAATPTTATTHGPSTLNSSGGEPGGLNGPASNADPRTVAGGVNIVAAGALKGWQVGTAPWPRVATAGADVSLARCLAMPVSHIGALVGATQPGGPSVYTSGWITRDSPSTGIESSVELNQSVVTQQSDIATLDGSGATSCLQGWFASLDVSDDAIVGVPSVKALDVSAEAGESAAGFSVSVSARSGGTLKNVDEQLIVLGAGRVEVGLVSESIGAFVSPALEATEVTALENRLRTVAGP